MMMMMVGDDVAVRGRVVQREAPEPLDVNLPSSSTTKIYTFTQLSVLVD
jgi:hypothetical protein